jgi:hypothetical protein
MFHHGRLRFSESPAGSILSPALVERVSERVKN